MQIGIIGCGYVGKALATFWNNVGHHVVTCTRSEDRVEELQNYADEVFVLSDNLAADFSQHFALCNLIVLAMAADSPKDYESAYLGTAQAFAKAKLPFLKHIIYTSSTSVYGEHQGNWIDETTEPKPLNRNTQILLETEKVLESLQSDQKRVCILRVGEIYGPGREITERLKSYRGKLLPGTGGNYTNVIHLYDIVRAIDFSSQHHLNGIYNLCNDVHVLRQELYNSLCENADLPAPQWDPALKSIHACNKRVSTAKLKKAGFRFQENEIT